MNIKTSQTILRDIYQDQIEEIYSAETQLLEALPTMAKRTVDQSLMETMQMDFEHTGRHIADLRNLLLEFPDLNFDLRVSRTMRELIQDWIEATDICDRPELRDIRLACEANRIKHYEIAAYQSALLLARALQKQGAADTLKRDLRDESNTSEQLTELIQAELLHRGKSIGVI